MKKNIIFIGGLLLFSWLLFILFTTLIVFSIETVESDKLTSNILHDMIGVLLIILWLAIWYFVTRALFLRNLKKIDQPNIS